MPIKEHPSFDRPVVSTRLWRYMDLPKFASLLTTKKLWMTNAEVLAADDPYEGMPSAVQLPHRLWKNIDDIPNPFRDEIIKHYMRGPDQTPSDAFRSFCMIQEQMCIFNQFWRREYYINCWHVALHESVAMWKIYAAPGAGVAVVSNGGRLETALKSVEASLYLGAVKYIDPSTVQIDTGNSFDSVMKKRTSFAYESEVRLVFSDMKNAHDPLSNDKWNDETMRFDDIIEDARPITPGVAFDCDIPTMIEAVVVSPFAPSWYTDTIMSFTRAMGYKFPVVASNLLKSPQIIA